MPGKSAITGSAGREENDAMVKSKERVTKAPKFLNGDEEANWWAARRGGVSQATVCRGGFQEAKGIASSGQAEPHGKRADCATPARADLAKARQIAGRKGIGYQTLLKMIVHEGLQREGGRSRSSNILN
jgi:hypothetical protein